MWKEESNLSGAPSKLMMVSGKTHFRASLFFPPPYLSVCFQFGNKSPSGLDGGYRKLDATAQPLYRTSYPVPCNFTS